MWNICSWAYLASYFLTKCLFKSLPNFNCLASLSSCENSLYIVDTSLLCMFCKHSLPVCDLLFHFHNCSFKMQAIFIFIKSKLMIFFFYVFYFLKSLLNPRSLRFSFSFFQRRFIALAYFCAYSQPMIPAPFVEKIILSSIVSAPLLDDQLTIHMRESISGLSILFCWFICQLLLDYLSWLLLALWQVLKLQSKFSLLFWLFYMLCISI